MMCPYCKKDIEEDSCFCDQCGEEILICPNCGKPGKGKMCIYDGTALVAARAKIKASASLPDGKVTSSGIDQVFTIKAPLSSTSANELHLINKNLGLDLKIEDGEIIGRKMGRFAEIFSKFSHVSKQHCRFKFEQKGGWNVIDLGSTNGTKYNDTLLKQGQPQQLANKSFLLIANIEFYVEIRSKADKTDRLG